MNWQWLLNDILKLFKWYSNERKAVGSGHVRKDRAHRFFVRVVFVLFETRRFCKVERFVFPDLHRSGTYICVRITDNGGGFKLNSANRGTGTGMKVIMQTIQILNAKNKEMIETTVHNIPLPDGETGCEVSFHLPLNYDYSV